MPMFMAMDLGFIVMAFLVWGIGDGIGDYIYRKKLLSIRVIIMIGMSLLAVSTVALLAFDVSTSIWVGAGILCIRAFAMSLTIQPLLFEMLATLTPQEMPDGNTLFNVTQRLSGSVGISALATIFQTQDAIYVADALRGYHVNAGAMHIEQGASAISSLPAVVRDKVDMAIIHGFHDSILVLAGLSILGLALAIFLKDNREKEAPGSIVSASPDPCYNNNRKLYIDKSISNFRYRIIDIRPERKNKHRTRQSPVFAPAM